MHAGTGSGKLGHIKVKVVSSCEPLTCTIVYLHVTSTMHKIMHLLSSSSVFYKINPNSKLCNKTAKTMANAIELVVTVVLKKRCTSSHKNKIF